MSLLVIIDFNAYFSEKDLMFPLVTEKRILVAINFKVTSKLFCLNYLKNSFASNSSEM